MKQPPPAGRKSSECITLARAHEEKLGNAPVPDAGFARDVQEGIDAHLTCTVARCLTVVSVPIYGLLLCASRPESTILLAVDMKTNPLL